MPLVAPDRISFFVAGLPETKGSWIALTKGRVKADNPREKAWAEHVGWRARMAMRGFAIFTERVSVEIYATLPPPPNKTKKNQRDGDKLARSCLDAMNGLVYFDDELVDSLLVRKRTRVDNAHHGARIVVTRWTPNDEGFDP